MIDSKRHSSFFKVKDLDLWQKKQTYITLIAVKTSVADPDPVFFGHPDPDQNPGKYRIRILYPQKDPMLFKFSRYKIV